MITNDDYEDKNLRRFAASVCAAAFPTDCIKAETNQCVYVLDAYIFYYIIAWPSDCSCDNWIIEISAAIAGDNWIIELMADIADELVIAGHVT